MIGNYTKAIILAVTMCIASLACGGIIGEPIPAAYESTCSSITHSSIDTGHPDPYATLKAYAGAASANAYYAPGETTPAAPVPLPRATPRHCVQLGGKYSFTLDDGRRFGSSSVRKHYKHDIALIELDILPSAHVPIAPVVQK